MSTNKPWSSTPAFDPQPIKAVAVARRVTQTKFARETGFPHHQVHYAFNGSRAPSADLVAAAVKYFDLPASKLFRPRRRKSA